LRAEPSPVDFSSSGQSDPHKLEVYPISSSPSDAAQPAIVPASEEEAEVLHASIKAGSVAQIVVAVIAVVGLIYLLKLVMVTTLSASRRLVPLMAVTLIVASAFTVQEPQSKKLRPLRPGSIRTKLG